MMFSILDLYYSPVSTLLIAFLWEPAGGLYRYLYIKIQKHSRTSRLYYVNRL